MEVGAPLDFVLNISVNCRIKSFKLAQGSLNVLPFRQIGFCMLVVLVGFRRLYHQHLKEGIAIGDPGVKSLDKFSDVS